MAVFRLALLHNYGTQASPPNMWYAHNYAQRRSHARNLSRSHYAHDYDVSHTHNPYHICHERLHSHAPITDDHYSPHYDYMQEYTHTPTHSHSGNGSRTHSAVLTHGLSQGHVYSPEPSHAPLSDVEVTHHYYNPGHNFPREYQFAAETPTARSRPHTTHNSSTRVRPTSHEPSIRVRPLTSEFCSLYPGESLVSSDEEENVVEARVDLPYTHHQCRGRGSRRTIREGSGGYTQGRNHHIITRFEDPGPGGYDDDGDQNGPVGLSYQQRDVCTATNSSHAIQTGEVGMGRVGGRRGALLLGEGLVREWVRAVGVVAASGTLVTLVVLGFGVYNMLITTLFLLFVLTTVALLIFLLMRRPPCCPCCHDPYDASAPTTGANGSQTSHITYLTETHGIVVKKWMKDSPPPYESPPEYSSLSPELIMDAKTLQDLVSTSQSSSSQSQGLPISVHNTPTFTSASSHGRSASPLCTTPLFSASFCDTPRSVTPTGLHDGNSKIMAMYERPPSPIFSSHQYPSSPANSLCHTSTYTASPAATATVPSAVFGQPAPPPPTYESLRLYSHEGGRRKDDNQ